MLYETNNLYQRENMGSNKGYDRNGHEHMMPKCTMNTAFSWNYENSCVLFPWWVIQTKSGLLFSCVMIAVFSYTYEYFRYYVHLMTKKRDHNNMDSKSLRWKRSIFYGIQIGLSFLVMLIIMSYNGFFIISVILGAVVGNFHWGSFVEDRLLNPSLVCH
ncbi:low-affinity Cu transporter Ecym_5103 [Eremothecium cymbalariae DBVPG|uniref:Copper transport protein n=1 Tax=Eremothecium cymbalariae (strain CBS 270.75 / DBVPG 7215 / KCTC 17166 / NRRL Y-17582) TaxID=931890 RepID=I6NCU4_ERECY|nr:hypothetical protein Ecym_5103 [Eremothecium cymbalariae DBVPG\